MYLSRYVFPVITLALSVVIAQDMPTVKSNDLSRTLITPILDTEIKPDQNLIYCATFQLAWNELRDSFPWHQPEDPEIIKQLDKKMFVKDYLSEDCYVAMSGTWKNIAKKINRILKEKFGDEAWPLTRERVLEDRFTENALMAYAFLFKDLVFKTMFESLDEPILFDSQGKSVEAEGFGIKEFMPDEEKHKNLGKQVSIYYYNVDYTKRYWPEFVIELKPESSNEEIIIAQISPKKTLLETIRNTQEIIASNKPDSLREDETVQIPKFDFDIEHNFTEIENNLASLVMGPVKAYQRIKFGLNEKGAVLKSEAIILIEELIMARRFIVSKPFLIYLKQKDSPYPYFAIWVENEEILVEKQIKKGR